MPEFETAGATLVALTPNVERFVRQMVRKHQLTFPVLLDKDQAVFFDQYAAFAMPSSFLIDRKGMLREKFLGEVKWDSPEIRSKIEKLLKEK